nr:branched-chain amino acid aminotransferase [uncultured bacterium]
MNGPTRVWINGKEVALADALVSVFDRGFLYGDAIFETIPVYDGHAFRMRAHLDRLIEGAAALRLEAYPAREALEHMLERAIRQTQDCVVRIALTRGRSGSGGLAASGAGPATTIVATLPPRRYAPELRAGGAAVVVSTVRHPSPKSLPTHVKHANYLSSILAYDQAHRAGADEAFMLGDEGQIVEAAFSNVFAVLDGTLTTPPIEDGALAGITRAALLELAQGASIPFKEDRLFVRDLLRADEIFVTNSNVGVMPVRVLQGLGPDDAFHRELKAPGRLTAQLAAAYWDLVRREAGEPW